MLSGNNLQNARNRYYSFVVISLIVCILFIALITSYYISIVPTYANKARLAEALTLVSEYKSQLTLEYYQQGKWPAKYEIDNSQDYLGNSIERIDFDGQGTINIVFSAESPELAMRVLSFSAAQVPTIEMRSILWVCGYAKPPELFEDIGNNITDVDSVYLPNACK